MYETVAVRVNEQIAASLWPVRYSSASSRSTPLAVYDDDGSGDGGSAAAEYMAKQIGLALEEVLDKAEEAREWLWKTASALTKEGYDIRWETPIGLPEVIHNEEPATKELHIWLYDRRMTTKDAKPWDKIPPDGSVLRRHQIHIQYERADGGKLASQKQRNGIAPNLIHSLDASHLMLTVEAAASEGIGDILTIHDCFATHAGDTERFSQIIWQQFVRMYTEHDPLEEIRRYAQDRLGNLTVPCPPRGT